MPRLLREIFLQNLTNSQNDRLHLEVFDGSKITKENEIFDDHATEDYEEHKQPPFIIKKTIKIMQQEWTLVWKNTQAFEKSQHTDTPWFVLLGGLFFTALFSIFLLISNARDSEVMQSLEEDKKLYLPFFVFLLCLAATAYLAYILGQRENKFIQNLVNEEARSISQIIQLQTESKLLALKRMGQRWEVAGGTPEYQWRADAENYTKNIHGLTTVEWVDNSYHVRWVEPLAGNEKALGLNILFNEEREQALKDAETRHDITITPPLDLVQGYKAFIAYSPVYIKNEFDGYMVGIFNIEDFFKNILLPNVVSNFAVTLSSNDQVFYQNELANTPLYDNLGHVKTLNVYDKTWQIHLMPTRAFVSDEKSLLPFIVLIAGILIAILIALTVRYILLSRIRSYHLRNSENTFRTALKDASIGMALVGLNGQWLIVNPALSEITGYSEEELLKTDFQTLTHPDDLAKDIEYFAKMISGEISSYQTEKRYIHKKGHVIWVLLSVSLARHTDGSPRYFIPQIQDITERKKVDEMKSEFISVVSHELRTPLTSIRGSLGLIQGTMAGDMPDKAKSLLDIAYKNCERLILLINDILDLDKITAGKMKYNIEAHDLHEMIEQGLEANQSYAEKFDVSLKPVNIAHDVKIQVDESRWQQIFANLLSNAIKFSPTGESVLISTEVMDEHVCISIQDFGPGIPPEFHKNIFEKFSQADSTISRNKGGTGLGLNITKQLVEAMGGTIDFETQVNKGTTFFITMPIYKEKNDRHARYNTQDVTLEEYKERARVLHIEDDEDFIELIRYALIDKVNYTSATTVEQANTILQNQEFDLIVLDIRLPDKSGTYFLKDDNIALLKGAPVVILTAHEPHSKMPDNVSAILIKSKTSEQKIIESILNILKEKLEGSE